MVVNRTSARTKQRIIYRKIGSANGVENTTYNTVNRTYPYGQSHMLLRQQLLKPRRQPRTPQAQDMQREAPQAVQAQTSKKPSHDCRKTSLHCRGWSHDCRKTSPYCRMSTRRKPKLSVGFSWKPRTHLHLWFWGKHN